MRRVRLKRLKSAVREPSRPAAFHRGGTMRKGGSVYFFVAAACRDGMRWRQYIGEQESRLQARPTGESCLHSPRCNLWQSGFAQNRSPPLFF